MCMYKYVTMKLTSMYDLYTLKTKTKSNSIPRSSLPSSQLPTKGLHPVFLLFPGCPAKPPSLSSDAPASPLLCAPGHVPCLLGLSFQLQKAVAALIVWGCWESRPRQCSWGQPTSPVSVLLSVMINSWFFYLPHPGATKPSLPLETLFTWFAGPLAVLLSPLHSPSSLSCCAADPYMSAYP